MDKLKCCHSPDRTGEITDLGRAGDFEFVLGRCTTCSSWWMYVFCPATNSGDYEPVSEGEASRMQTIPRGPELKNYLKNWFNNR